MEWLLPDAAGVKRCLCLSLVLQVLLLALWSLFILLHNIYARLPELEHVAAKEKVKNQKKKENKEDQGGRGVLIFGLKHFINPNSFLPGLISEHLNVCF